MVLLIAMALVACRRYLRSLASAHVATLAVVVALIVFAATYGVHVGPYLVLGISADTVRQAVIAGERTGGTLRRLAGSLTTGDIVRLALDAAVLVVLALRLLVHAWRQRRFRFFGFVVGCGVALAAVALFRPIILAVVVSNFQGSRDLSGSPSI
jgi:hypothetical protein